VLDVRGAFLFRVLITLDVIIAIRQTKAALYRLSNFPCAVLCVLARPKLEERVNADCMEMRNGLKKIGTVLDRVDAF
jgi:hypothetical protein